jgi:hypothetical protein
MRRGRYGAVRAYERAPAAEPIERAARATLALWNERLFFEVHEVLEAVWKTATGATRQVLQGVIQIAVAYHHLAHGNLRGARDAARRGTCAYPQAPVPRSWEPIDLEHLLAATAAWEPALTAHSPLPDALPRLTSTP